MLKNLKFAGYQSPLIIALASVRGSLLGIYMYNGVWSVTSPTKILVPGRAATYQFHSRMGKTKIKNGDQWNYVTQTVTFFVYEQEEKSFRVQPVSSSVAKLLWRGEIRGVEERMHIHNHGAFTLRLFCSKNVTYLPLVGLSREKTCRISTDGPDLCS